MVITITARGNTLRSMVNNFADQLLSNGYQFDVFDTMVNNGKDQIGKLGMKILNILSNNNAMDLLNHTLKKEQKHKIDTLNTVCLSAIFIFIFILYAYHRHMQLHIFMLQKFYPMG